MQTKRKKNDVVSLYLQCKICIAVVPNVCIPGYFNTSYMDTCHSFTAASNELEMTRTFYSGQNCQGFSHFFFCKAIFLYIFNFYFIFFFTQKQHFAKQKKNKQTYY